MNHTTYSRMYGLVALLAGSFVMSCSSPLPTPVVSQLTPSPICDQTDPRVFTIQGSGFLIKDALPTVTFTNLTNPAVTATVTATSAAGCTDSVCTSLTVSFPSAQLPDGSYSAAVTNACSEPVCTGAPSLPPIQADVVAVPTLTAVAPSVVCQGQGSLTLTGSDFYSGATVLVGGASSMSVSVASGGTSATANFAGMLPLSPVDATTNTTAALDVTIQNAAGCAATLAKALTVTPGPSILFVDPPVLPLNYSLQATIYAASVGGTVQSIAIAPSGSSNFTTLTGVVIDPTHPNRVLVNLPGNLAAGSYDVRLNDLTTCAATLPNAFKVVATQTLTVTSVTPSFGALGTNTAVQTAGTGFLSTPRAYVAINGGGSGVSAAALRAVTYSSGSLLNAVVPSGLAAGTYDLIVVNPDGTFGVLAQAFVVTASTAPPPVITGITPSQVVENTTANITINGSGFRSVSLTPTCYDAANAMVAGATAAVGAVNGTGTSITATLSAPVGSAYCLLRVRETDNGVTTFFDYSAIGVTNNSNNLSGFKAGTNLGTARRALGAAAGRPTQVARYVYAIGGDNGSDNAPLKTVEAAPTGLDGTLQAFSPLTAQLPKALSFLGVVNLGRFLYAVGGFDGTAAVSDVYRAEILDPLSAPQFANVDVRPNLTQGLAPGLYTYRISAVLGPTDPNNPSGETLAGDFFPVQIPPISMGSLQLVLSWPQVPNAASYNIYRTVKAGDLAGTEQLLAKVTDSGVGGAVQSYIDTGMNAPAGATPLALGSTGAWMPLAKLNTGRAGAGVAVAPDPMTAGTYYLYALGGNSGTPAAPTALTSVEFLKITYVNGGAQQMTAAAWTTATQALLTARWLGPAFGATRAENSNIPMGQSYIYSGSGLRSNLATGTTDDPVYAAQIAVGGQPGVFTGTGTGGIRNPGYGATLVNNQLLGFGGTTAGMPTTASLRSTLSNATMLSNFASLGGGVLTTPRTLQGTAIESAFIYQLGGLTTGGTALRSTEQTIW